MTVKEFITKLKAIEKNHKTVYMYATYGFRVDQSNINEKKNQKGIGDWYTKDRVKHLEGLIGRGYWGFDCVNLIKGILWGWVGDTSKSKGGATYNSNGVPDTSADGFIQKCKTTGTNFRDIKVGDVVWMKGHIGVYIGSGLAIECTPRWANGVQITAVLNIGSKAGYNGRTWTKWGRNPYIDYGGDIVADFKRYVRYGEVLKQGAKGTQVKKLQEDLIKLGYGKYMEPYGADSSFGGATFKAVVAIQKDNGLEQDGVPGPATQAKIDALLKAPAPATDYRKLYEDAKKQLDTANKKLADIQKAGGW